MSDDYRMNEGYSYPEDYEDSKWHGVPPAGERPIKKPLLFILGITLVIVAEIFIWAIYRQLTADFYGQFGTYWFYVGHIIAAPLIHLGPIVLYWKFIRKERIFTKSDKENGQYMAINLGPFKMTRKFLLTAVLVGLFGGIIWRFTEMAVSDITGVALGGYTIGTFWIYDIFTGSDFWLFLLMTFVMFFVVGPVEEFEFRSFTHDQAQRVMPKWAALIYSSVFFGFSHIPIALFVYKLSPAELIFAEISWMTAGAVFGALYMWSRNIFACIVMHGIGNWQLSVFFWQSKIKGVGLDDTQYLIVSFVTSIVANAILIVLFYLIHKFYWEPQRNGEAAFGGKLLAIQTAFFKHDNGTKNIGGTAGALSATTVIVLVVLVLGTVIAGIPVNAPATEAESGDPDVFDTTGYSEMEETHSESNEMLPEGESTIYSFESSAEKVLIGLDVTLTWEDEDEKPGRPTIRRYTNQPDTFSVGVNGANISVEGTDSNVVNQAGTIILNFNIPEANYTAINGEFGVDVTVTMVDAGMWTGFGILGFTDPGNGYDIQVGLKYLQSPDYVEPEPEEVTEEQPE